MLAEDLVHGQVVVVRPFLLCFRTCKDTPLRKLLFKLVFHLALFFLDLVFPLPQLVLAFLQLLSLSFIGQRTLLGLIGPLLVLQPITIDP